MTRPAVVLLALGFTLTAAAGEQQPPKARPPVAKTDPKKTDPAEAEALSQVLRTLVKKHLPDPLSTSKQNWGHQKAVTVIRRHREGLRVWSEPVQELRNEGVWRRVTIRIPEPDKLAVAVTELTHPEDGKLLVTVAAIAERVDLRVEQQVWRNGLRLYSGETRGHCKAALLAKGEVVTKTEFKKGSYLPDVTLTLKVTKAELFYENLEIDHTAGLDGDAAEVLGDLMIRAVKAIKPDLEEELLAKANAAIVKAGGTRELHLALDKLLAAKGKNPGKK